MPFLYCESNCILTCPASDDRPLLKVLTQSSFWKWNKLNNIFIGCVLPQEYLLSGLGKDWVDMTG